MQKHGKKLCALLLALCMIVGFIPMTANAALLDGDDYIIQQMLLGEDIVLHLRGDIPEEYRDGATAKITFCGNTNTYTIDDITPDADGLYDMPIEMAAAQLTDDIDVVVTGKLGLIDVEAIKETYTGRDYLKTLIEGNYTRETKQLAQELLNYGAWAQKYFDYNTDNLANKGYDITVSNPVPSEIPTVPVKGKVDGVKFYGVSVRFISKTAVRFYFTAENGVDGYTFTVDGTEYTPNSKDDLYYIEVGGINPQYMDTEMAVKVTDGNSTLSFGYTPTNYFIRNYHKTTDENFKGLMEAAYSYFMTAQEFAGVTDTGSLTFEYTGGNANSIQVNTNLPADVPLADFALTDNGCSVNEDANTKKASNVSMANVDGKIVLTFNFAESFAAGETYSLPKNAFFCFTDNSQFALAQDYLFQFNGTDWTQVAVSGDFLEGVDFENIGNTLLFTGEGPASKAATVMRVAHETEIPGLSNGGDYALKLTHASSYYPTFRVNFGKELAAGTQFSFMAFGIIFGDSQYDHSVFEFNDGGDATVQFNSGEWTQLTMTLPEAADHVDLFWNFERAGLSDANTTGAVYVDNFVAVEPIDPEGDFLKGVDFETAGNAALFEGQGVAGRDAVIVRTSYANAGIEAPVNGGNYALKLSHPSNYWPTFRINFGKELVAGTTITFDAYAKINGENLYNVSIFEFMAGGEATTQFGCGAWTKLTMTLPETADHIDLFWNYDRANITSTTASGEVYIDNMIAVEPAEPTGDFLEGVDFETAGNEMLFGAVGGDNAWRDATLTKVPYSFAGVPAPANGGEYALKITCASSQWPVFRINFGKTLKAGTVISFQAYSRDISDPERNTVSIFESIPGESYLVYTSSNGATVQYPYNSWNNLTIVLAEDRSYVDLVCNMDRWSEPGPANLEVYLDNFKAEEPVLFTGDFETGVGLEDAGDILQFTGEGGSQNATVDRVTYADAGVSAPANGGSYALKVSHTSSCWPNFRVNFGKTLKAGTVITFDVYGNYNYAAAEGVTKYVKLELTADSKNYATSADPNQVLWTVVETWRTGVTITLTADSDHVDFFYNVADGQHGEVASWLLMDNFKATQPAYITNGLTFENSSEANLFEGLTQDINIDRVSYTDAGVSAPANGGSYALKVSHANSCWPNFRVNFGKTLKAGTVITFDVYGNYDYAAAEGVTKYVKLELTADSKNYATSEDPNQVLWTVVETWRTGVTITLTADSDHVDLFYNVADGQHGDVASWILMDNFLADEPVYITDGLTFENSSDAELFDGLTQDINIDRVSYADAGVAAPANGGSYALKVSHASSCWPNFRLSFGKTLKAGTVITFDVYGNYDYVAAEGVYKYVKLELAADSKNYATSADPNQVLWTLVETWNTGVAITLTADSDHVDFFYNVADGQHGDVASWLLLDNFQATQPITISDGLSFNNSDEIELFTGIGGDNAWRDASVEIVSFDGDNALKLSCSSSAWPTFRINFGETLTAGTTITFDFYGNYEYTAAEGEYKYVKLELNGDSKNYATSADPNQVVWTLVETWNTGVTITLTADCDYIDFFYNVADGQHGESPASWIMLDDFVVVKP